MNAISRKHAADKRPEMGIAGGGLDSSIHALTRLFARAEIIDREADERHAPNHSQLQEVTFAYEDLILAEWAIDVSDARIQALLLRNELQFLIAQEATKEINDDIVKLGRAANSIFHALNRVCGEALPSNLVKFLGGHTGSIFDDGTSGQGATPDEGTD